MSKRKYSDGQTVLINKFWTTKGGGQMLPGKAIKATVVSARNTPTLGWLYTLEACIPLHICYNEEDIADYLVFDDDPDAIWKAFGDQ
tara:strand:- start:25 stop:285 length:261 start_codon:yes stop_codon:yes gene_type:complete